MNYSELSDLTIYRQNIYQMLSGFFIEPLSEAMIPALSKLNFPEIVAAERGTWKGNLLEGYKLIGKSIAELSAPNKTSAEKKLKETEEDYFGLFDLEKFKDNAPEWLVNGKKENSGTIGLCESDHLNDRMDGKTANVQLRQLFEEKELKVPSMVECFGYDHISFEFQYMAALCRQMTIAISGISKDGVGSAAGAEMIGSLRHEQYSFLIEHLTKWAGIVANEMLKKANTDFYQGLAKITLGFIGQELVLLKDEMAWAEWNLF